MSRQLQAPWDHPVTDMGEPWAYTDACDCDLCEAYRAGYADAVETARLVEDDEPLERYDPRDFPTVTDGMTGRV